MLFIPIPFLFYYATMCPTIGLGDTALLLDAMIRLSFSSHVNSHNFTILFGKIFQLLAPGEIAFRGNLVSVFFGATAVVSVYIMALRMTGSAAVSAVAAAAVMVSHSLWWHSTIAEVYAVNACFTVWIAYCMFRYGEDEVRYLYMASLLAGLALFNHVELGFWIPAIGVVILVDYKNDIKKLFTIGLKSTLFFLIGFLPYLAVLVYDIARSSSARRVLYWAAGGDFQSIMMKSGFLQGLIDFLILSLLNYPSPYLLFIIAGLYYGFRAKRYRKLFIAMSVGFCINTIFFMQFPTWDKFAHLLSSFLMLGISGIAGIDIVFRKWLTGSASSRYIVIGVLSAGILAPVILYEKIPVRARNPATYWYARYNNNYTENTHDCSTYILNPDKHAYFDIRTIADLIFTKAPDRAILVDDDSRTYYPLAEYYQKYYGKRPDITIMLINSWGFKNWGSTEQELAANIKKSLTRRPVFLISRKYPFAGLIEDLYTGGIVAEKFRLDEKHWIYRLLPKEKAHPSPVMDLDICSVKPGINIYKTGIAVKDAFNSNEIITARLILNNIGSNEEVEFAWRDQSGRLVYKSSPHIVPPGNIMIWSYLEASNREPGTWTVEVLVDGLPSGIKTFRIK
jgi:hypothetical protein